MHRPYNFSAGPAALPTEVLQQAAAEMLDWHGTGLGVMEMSHRSSAFGEILDHAQSTLRRLLAVPDDVHILFVQGGGLGENAAVPLNLSRGGAVDVVVSGAWSAKSAQEAARYADVAIAASSKNSGYCAMPDPASWRIRPDAAYVHVCSNETIHGVELADWPDLAALGSAAPLVVDCSSHILSRPMDWSRIGLAFAGAQKNIGPAGLTLVFVKDSLLGRALPICPQVWNYTELAAQQSMVNTPPTYAIYMAGLVFDWIERQGGVPAMQAAAQERAALLYDYLDASDFYENRVAPGSRSLMNVPFFLKDESRNADFLAQAQSRGLLQLKGHKSVGGMRASIYNAMPLAGVQALVDFLRDFERGQ
ncbi:3-phosphoserine/phosphohydroxythreonine transaminase [Amphibiibacter pelophylacis]|uniref:3-phosphoserine/phosphohydroxythreonine transaminase n=1 Tax=Amphibiibacter pelophylacis TaxID=1799477 RepID=A0ACC6P3D4_9BURK